jgi:hypothetical protein
VHRGQTGGPGKDAAFRVIAIQSSGNLVYLNVFVLVEQAFQKVPVLKAMAPTPFEVPFVVVQLVVMALLAVLGIFAVKRFHADDLSVDTIPMRKNL